MLEDKRFGTGILSFRLLPGSLPYWPIKGLVFKRTKYAGKMLAAFIRWTRDDQGSSSAPIAMHYPDSLSFSTDGGKEQKMASPLGQILDRPSSCTCQRRGDGQWLNIHTNQITCDVPRLIKKQIDNRLGLIWQTWCLIFPNPLLATMEGKLLNVSLNCRVKQIPRTAQIFV